MSNAGGQNSRQYEETRRRLFGKHPELEAQLKIIETQDSSFFETILKIEKAYTKSRGSYESTLAQLVGELSGLDTASQTMHSIRHRLKDVDSLLAKIIMKRAQVSRDWTTNPEIEKYRNISEKNYYKIITDIIGIRILIRYRHQWKAVHELIWSKYYDSTRPYISDWEGDYVSDPGVKYIVEQPKAHVKQEEDRKNYEDIGKNILDIRSSDNKYASIHYIINLGGRYVELQVRTIFDEAWCECNHDFVYKKQHQGAKVNQEILSRLSVILSQHTTAAESITSLMYELASPSARSEGLHEGSTLSPAPSEKVKKTFRGIQKYAEKLSIEERKEEYE